MRNAVAAELQAMMENLSGDVSWELRKRGFTDPDALRDFATYYGAITAEVPLEDDEPPGTKAAAALVGGFLLGLEYCQRRGGLTHE